MKNKYFKTPEGKVVKVTNFDEVNKMCCVNSDGLRNHWYHENEYSTWVETDAYGNENEAEQEDVSTEPEIKETVEVVEKAKKKAPKKEAVKK